MTIHLFVIAGTIIVFLALSIFYGTKRGRRLDRALQLKALNKRPQDIQKFFEKHPKWVEPMKQFLDENYDVKKDCTEVYEFVSCYRLNQ